MKIEILPASPLQPREGVNFENTRKEKQIKIRNHMENFETLPRWLMFSTVFIRWLFYRVIFAEIAFFPLKTCGRSLIFPSKISPIFLSFIEKIVSDFCKNSPIKWWFISSLGCHPQSSVASNLFHFSSLFKFWLFIDWFYRFQCRDEFAELLRCDGAAARHASADWRSICDRHWRGTENGGHQELQRGWAEFCIDSISCR